MKKGIIAMLNRNGALSRFAFAAFFCLALLCTASSSQAGNPNIAVYSPENTRIFWFILMSDIHIGAKGDPGNENLTWITTEGKDVIQPAFIVSTGDLTDSTDWSDSGYPDGPHAGEWQVYRNILDQAGMDDSFYYDIPGNHDHFGDERCDYYLNYSIQGVATGQTQISWTRSFDFGTYHFLGVNTAGNDGEDFSFAPPYYGDNAGLDASELLFIENELELNKNADLTFVFGHHPIITRPTEEVLDESESWTITALSYGADEFIALLDRYNVLMYGYGHSHIYREEFFTQGMAEGMFYLNVGSLTKSDKDQFNIVAVDCNGVSTVPLDVGAWPAVIITAPLDKNLGVRNNPYTANVTNESGGTYPVRALVFDKTSVARVEYRVFKIVEKTGDVVRQGVEQVDVTTDAEGFWHPMSQVASSHPYYPYLWEADASAIFSGGDYTIEVRAVGSSIQTDSIPARFPSSPVDKMAVCFISAAAVDSPDTKTP